MTTPMRATRYAVNLVTLPSGRDLTKTTKLVLCVLAHEYNPDLRYASASVREIAADAVCTKVSARAAFKVLSEEGILYITETEEPDGSRGPNKYYLPHYEVTCLNRPFVVPTHEIVAYYPNLPAEAIAIR